MDCYYCGEPASYHLDELEGEEVVPRKACYHCFQLLKSVEQEHRKAYLIEVLQKHHATAMLMPDTSEYKKHWLEKLADRISWAQVGYRSRPGFYDMRQRSELLHQSAQSVAPEVPEKTIVAVGSGIKPKPIKIKKLG